jgi:4-hydroxy-2-oxoheptanedioate aldolase
MDRTTFKEICRTRTQCWGSAMVHFMTPDVVRAYARAGFDWIWIDNEHGHHSYESIYDIARTADDVGIITILRVPDTEYHLIARALDMAVSGIMVPRVETPEQARRIVDCAKYPPVGRRGFGMRSTLFGKLSATMAERVEDQNDGRILVIQIESRKGVENLDAMIAVAEGQIDAVVFGYADFQMDIGKPDHPDDPEVVAAARHIVGVCEKHGISTGTPVGSPESARHWKDLGFNLITLGSDDRFLCGGAAEARESLRALD